MLTKNPLSIQVGHREPLVPVGGTLVPRGQPVGDVVNSPPGAGATGPWTVSCTETRLAAGKANWEKQNRTGPSSHGLVPAVPTTDPHE